MPEIPGIDRIAIVPDVDKGEELELVEIFGLSNERDLAPQPRHHGHPVVSRAREPSLDALRAELRQLVVEELAQLIKR